jgi:DNA invertase Pin-like site-specific DNA recombinase
MTDEITNVRYCLYSRKSSESDEKQALSIEAQVKEMSEMAAGMGLMITEVRRESHSAKDVGKRPVFNSLLTDIKSGKFNGILTWAPDRLSRNAGDLGALVDLMDQGLLHTIQTHGQRFTNNPNEKFLLMILGSQAKLENDHKSKNVQRGLRARCEQGLWPAPAPTGYLNHPDRTKKCHVIVDPERGPVVKKIFENVGVHGWSGRKVYFWLKDIGFKGQQSKDFSLANIYRMLRQDFYYGRYQFPQGSDIWYNGVHVPLVSKELFDRVQEQLDANDTGERNKKEFAFTRLMICGSCGSGISAQEKFKKLKDGGINRHVYYSCTKSRDKNCKGKYLREEDLVKQLIDLVYEMDFAKSGLQEKLKLEIERFAMFQHIANQSQQKVAVSKVDIKKYVKYILQHGRIEEQREVMSSFRSKVVLENRILDLIK